MFLAIQSGMQVHELLVLKLDQSINNKMLNNEMLLSNMVNKSEKHGVSFVLSAEDCVDTSELTEASLRTIAGNGMSLACSGFALLMAVCCLDDK